MIREILSSFSILGSLIAAPMPATKTNDQNVIERVGLSIHNLEICHQGNWREMTFNIQYETEPLGESNDIAKVKAFVRQFLDNYPNMTDFWEVMNTKLVVALTEEYSDIKALQSKLGIAADQDFSFPRESIVYYSRESGITKESFRFTKLNHKICNETFKKLDLEVIFDYKQNPIPSDYPDYQWIDQAMNEFFAKDPISFSKWEEIKPKLEAFLKERFPTLPCLEIKVKAE